MDTRELLTTITELDLPIRIIGSGRVVRAIVGVELREDEMSEKSLFLLANEDLSMSREFVDRLAGETCTCGATKQSGRVFCGLCFNRLTRQLKVAVKTLSGRELEEAYTLGLICLARRVGRERED